MELKELGERIKVGRMSRGMTQAELAEKVGVAASTVGMWEQGRREPDLEMLEAIADVYNTELSYFVNQSDITVPPAGMTKRDRARLEAFHENPRLGLLFDRTINLPEEDIDIMERIVSRILKERDND